jgi:tetratricopeptide (TPR) repeat protein
MKGSTARRGGLWRRWWGAAADAGAAPRTGPDGVEPLQQGHRAVEQQLIAAVTRAERQGDDPAALASAIARLAELYRTRARYDEAERLYQRAIALSETHRLDGRARLLNGLALVYRAQGFYDLAEPLCRRALEIAEREHGADHAITVAAVRNLMTVCLAQRRYLEAGPLLRRAVAEQERILGPAHPALAGTLSTYAALLRKTRADDEAMVWEERARAIRERRRS